jgi:hypothetical protein
LQTGALHIEALMGGHDMNKARRFSVCKGTRDSTINDEKMTREEKVFLRFDIGLNSEKGGISN